jgi:MFS family permease
MANASSFRTKILEALLVLVLCSSHLLTQAALGQVIAPLLIISKDLDSPNVMATSWYVAAYSLTVGTFVLIAGQLGDNFGHRFMILVGYVWLGLWSIICGFSVYSGNVLFIVSRAFQGIGPAILLPNSLAILAHTFPPGIKKNVAFSLFGAAAPNGFILGCVFSSLFAQFVWWPWAFWVMGMVSFGFVFLVFFIVPPQASDQQSRRNLEQVDLLGAITGVTGLVLVNVAWNQGAAVGWETPYVYVLLIIGCAFLLLFSWVETRASHPLLPKGILNMDTGFVLTCIACGWSSFGIWLFYSWQISERILEYSPLSVVAQFTPVGISGVIAAFSAAYLLIYLGPYYIMTMSMASFLIGSLLFMTAPLNQTYWAQAFVSIIIMPWGMVSRSPSNHCHWFCSATTFLSEQHGSSSHSLAFHLGSLLPIWHNSAKQCGTSSPSGHRCFSHEHCGKLLYFNRTRNCRDGGEQSKQRRKRHTARVSWGSISGCGSSRNGLFDFFGLCTCKQDQKAFWGIARSAIHSRSELCRSVG